VKIRANRGRHLLRQIFATMRSATKRLQFLELSQ